MLHRTRSREYGSSTPGPTCFTKQQMGNFLSDLRKNRPPRPTGSRPPPESNHSPSRRSFNPSETLTSRSSTSSDTSKALGHSRSSSALSFHRGQRSLASGRTSPEKIHANTTLDHERRRVEREDGYAVRLAMDALDVGDDETVRKHAEFEATELVEKHQNNYNAYRVPIETKIKAQSGLSQDPSGMIKCAQSETKGHVDNNMASNASRDTSLHQQSNRSPFKRRSIGRLGSGSFSRKAFASSIEKIWQDEASTTPSEMTSEKKEPTAAHTRRNPFARAQSARQNDVPTSLCRTVSKQGDKADHCHNPPSQSRDPPHTSNHPPTEVDQTLLLSETPDEPTNVRYKNGIEVRSDDIRAATSRSLRDRSPNLPSPSFISDSPERPIVSFQNDWKPMENPGNEKHNVRSVRQRPTPEPKQEPNHHSKPSKSVSAPIIPTLQDMDEASHTRAANMPARADPPSIVVADVSNVPQVDICDEPLTDVTSGPLPLDQCPSIPTFSTQEPEAPESAAATPTPKPRPRRSFQSPSTRPVPRHTATAPATSLSSRVTRHAMREGSTLCAQCALPIYGRTVTAAGTRFHPECFVCFHCGEALECVQFYPEPSASREERLERIDRRMAGEDVEPPQGVSLNDDSDDSLRFYCHLDYHEFFSPRCKNCKTPIEGEMIVALGGQYHPGHFFCANCGDVSSSANTYATGS